MTDFQLAVALSLSAAFIFAVGAQLTLRSADGRPTVWRLSFDRCGNLSLLVRCAVATKCCYVCVKCGLAIRLGGNVPPGRLFDLRDDWHGDSRPYGEHNPIEYRTIFRAGIRCCIPGRIADGARHGWNTVYRYRRDGARET